LGQKPIGLETSSRSVICVLYALGCGTTPIDAVVQDDPAAATMSGTGNVTPMDCSTPSAGRFVLRGRTGCLALGAATTVFTQAAFLSELSNDCTTPVAQWDLTPAAAGTFTLRNVASELSLDVRAAADVPGTPIILYDPTTHDNQRFFVRARASHVYELAPLHASAFCAEARGTGVEIWPCDAQNAGQSFEFFRPTCP
jgi:hypothetical protein